tara:strand:+ start:47 stop:295 length:249 start_codon:yes stop_codon:yes gene_type:complete
MCKSGEMLATARTSVYNSSMQLTTASQVAKSYGLKSLKEVSIMTDLTVPTLIGWYKKKYDLFIILILGCVAKKQIDELKNGD